MAANNDKNNRVFLYEVVINPKMGKLSQIDGLFQRRGKFYLKVPHERMSQEMQKISRLGGKIVNIIPINTLNDLFIEEEEELSWWVEITTTHPHCIYYFGPFDSFVEAYEHQGGYVEDLQEEGAKGIIIHIKQCQPLVLTQELEEETSPVYKY
ncbi:hypothetical protein cce_3206 [Crocosphaera subtropica ATCC 51142]|uniref:CpcD-like domain-containing protein n=1 Tax=Crocosphaera subtropica (strain ATCC 51142 / BH68) TaxID=43989 RepID=B1WXL3_CROS5|nr:DUF1816 domain-containing protein [Crocosphaera subtropica]ACB52554.1 hypothetical protein cce_3206 [Crocosphaera subtropica ATCC 51142]